MKTELCATEALSPHLEKLHVELGERFERVGAVDVLDKGEALALLRHAVQHHVHSLELPERAEKLPELLEKR